MSTSRRYFGGPRVEAPVALLTPNTFEALVADLGSPASIPYTRAEFLALPKDERNKAKNSSYITPVNFKESPCRRADENADQLVLACFDLDDEADFVGGFFQHPETVAEALWPYSFIMFCTASHTPEKPRLRILVDVEPCAPALYRRFIRYIAFLLGMPPTWKGERESKVLSQPMFRPVKFIGEKEALILNSRTNGVPITELDLPEETSEDARERKFAYESSSSDGDDDLENLPIAGLEVEDIRECLFSIDADCDYRVWTRVISSVRHQWRTEEDAEKAFNLVRDWSEQGDKYPGHNAVLAKWDSFRPDATGRKPTTIRTLFHLAATEYGWKPDKVSKKLELSVAERIAACKDPDTLRRDAPKWVAALPFGDSISDEIFADLILKAFAACHGGKVSSAAVKREISKARREVKAEAATGNIPGWLRPWCFISSQNKFYNTVTGSLLTPDAFDNALMHHMPKAEDNPERAAMTPRGYAVAHDGLIVKADALVYDPRHGGEKQFFKLDGDERVFVNEYRTSSLPKLDPVNSEKAVKYVFKHLLKQMSREDALHVMDWIAYSVQFPGKRIRHAIFIQGAQGCGKSIISAIIAAAIGDANATVVGPKEISSDFSGWATGGQLTTIEEIWVQGKGRAAVMNCLKPLITNNRVTITKKGVDPVTMDNVTNYIAYSNHRNALYLEPDDRRWFVIMSFIQTAAQKQALADTMIGKRRYFDFYGYLVKELAGALRHGFLNYGIRSSFDPDGDAPKTVFQEQVIADCKNKMWREMEYIIADGDSPLIGRDILFMPAMETVLGRERMKDNYHPDHYAYAMGFQPWGERASLNGSGKGQIWVHNELYDPAAGDPKDILMARYEKIPDELI